MGSPAPTPTRLSSEANGDERVFSIDNAVPLSSADDHAHPPPTVLYAMVVPVTEDGHEDDAAVEVVEVECAVETELAADARSLPPSTDTAMDMEAAR